MSEPEDDALNPALEPPEETPQADPQADADADERDKSSTSTAIAPFPPPAASFTSPPGASPCIVNSTSSHLLTHDRCRGLAVENARHTYVIHAFVLCRLAASRFAPTPAAATTTIPNAQKAANAITTPPVNP